jgi:putative FmdB family regulatory protein
MPLYPFRCPQCGLEFEVSRPMSKAGDPATCPLDGATGTRIFTAPARLTAGRGESAPAPTPPPRPASTWSHFGHTHGAGVAAHSHGPYRPPPAAPRG